jgi:hypothetical protein
VLSLVAAIALLWPRPTPAPPPPPPVPVAAKAAPVPPPRRAAPRAAPAPARAAPAAAVASPRERLLAAVRARAPDLAACAAPPGSPTRAATRLRIGKDGTPRSVQLDGAALPASLAACVRERVLAWRFDELGLPTDVDVLVAFSLAP